MTTADLDRRRARPHAWLFAITATIGLLPGAYGVVMAAMTGVLLPPVVWLWGPGVALLIGYWMYLLGRPMPAGPRLLWRGSALYNLGLAIAVVLLGLDGVARGFERGVWDAVAGLGMTVLWLLFLAGVAAHAEARDAPSGPALDPGRRA